MEIDCGSVLDALPAMVWTALPDGHIDFVNRRWSEYTGLGLDEAHGWEWQTAVNPDDLPKLLERWRSILASGVSGEMEARVRRFDGHYRWFLVQCSPIQDDAGRIVKWCGAGTDVEDFRRAQESLRRRELDFQLIVDSIPIPVAVTTPAGEVEGLNQPTLDYFGKTFEELKGWKASDVVHPDDLEHTIAAQLGAHQKGSSYNVESRHRRADGVYRWYNVLGLPLRDPQGSILRWLHLLIDIDDRKRAEEAVAASEHDSRLIVDSIPGMVSAHTPDGEIEFINRQLIEFFGKTLEEMKYWKTDEMTHPEDLPRAVELFSKSIASGAPFDFEVRARRFDGVYRWLQTRGLPLRDADGRIVRWYNLLIDIDERKRAEEALAASERELRLIVDTIPGLIALFGSRGEVEGLNKQFLAYLGQTQEEFANWATNGTVHPDDLERHIDTLKRSLDTGLPIDFETRLRRFDGVYRWFQIRGAAARDAAANIVRWYCVMSDVDERKRAEDELRRSEAFLAEGQRLSLTGTFSWRVPTDEIIWSEQIYRIFEFDPSVPVTVELIGSRVHPDDMHMLIDMVERARGDGGDFEYEHRLQMLDHSIKHLHLIGHASRDKDGRVEYIGAIQDITQRRLAEQALAEARSELAHVTRVTSLGALTASIAHEVNQPLAGIVTNASTCLRMLAADPPNIEGARETARRTIRDGNRAADVIARLRGLFTKKSGAIEPVDLNEATREVIALSSGDIQRNRVAVRTELRDDIPVVDGDRVQLQQVILNLLRNATDAMSGVEDRPRQLVIRTEPDEDHHVRLTVQDAGTGFEPHGAERLFQPFYTTKSDGMGIGLSVSRSIIESHRGRLWATANHGPGATFAFSIPRGTGRPTGDHTAGAIGAPAVRDAHAMRNP